MFVHCGALSVGVRKKLGLPSLFDMRYSNPLDVHPVAHRFPSLRFIVPHFGAGLFREALMLADLCPNVWLDTSAVIDGWHTNTSIYELSFAGHWTCWVQDACCLAPIPVSFHAAGTPPSSSIRPRLCMSWV